MSIPEEIIESVRSATDIVELVREYVPNLKKSGRNWKANCPFHNEKSPSFMVNAERGIFHCFGCQKGGDAFTFVMEMDSLSWPEAIRKLAARANITVNESRDDSYKSSERQKLFELLESAAMFYHRCLKESADAAGARAYLQKRGITDETIEAFRIGFAPEKRLIAAAGKQGYTVDQLMAAGLVTRTERGTIFEYMSGRVVFPIYSAQGRVVAFGGRTLNPEGQPKYLNSPETAVYSKSEHLYGLYQAIGTVRKSREIVVLEGYMDVVVTHQAGVTNTVGTLGTALTQQHGKMLGRYADKVTLLFDPDAAGFNAARRAIETLIETELMLAISELPDGLDPDEYILKYGTQKFLEIVAASSRSSIEFLTDHIISKKGAVSAEQKARVASEVIPLLNQIKNSIVRREWVRHLAEKIGSTEEAVLEEWRRVSKTGSTRAAQPKPAAPAGDGSQQKLVHTAEEELLQLLVSHPELTAKVNETAFSDERNRAIFKRLSSGAGTTDILSQLQEPDVSWFRSLIMLELSHAHPEHTMNMLLRGIERRRLVAEFSALEPTVLQMFNGVCAKDDACIQRYHELVRLLKGSVK